jgi:L-ascorbate metabolism protein UlaG (beta-lactamase superfamily)
MESLASTLDLALLPIWGWGPTVGRGHLDPIRAATALSLLRPRTAVPIHWGTYRVIGAGPGTSPGEPAERFLRQAAEVAPAVDVRVLQPGESLEL